MLRWIYKSGNEAAEYLLKIQAASEAGQEPFVLGEELRWLIEGRIVSVLADGTVRCSPISGDQNA